MSRKFRSHLTYANLMSSMAIFLVLAGGGAYAAKKLKLKNNSVTTPKIKDGAVTTPKIADTAVSGAKIADNAVGGAKLADNSVTSAKVADNSITGADVQENTLNFPCTYPVNGNQIKSGGLCLFSTASPGGTWRDAIASCHSQYARIPTVAEVVGGAIPNGPFRNTTSWTSDLVTPGGAGPATAAFAAVTDPNGAVTTAQTSLGSTLLTTALCVYDPASTPGT